MRKKIKKAAKKVVQAVRRAVTQAVSIVLLLGLLAPTAVLADEPASGTDAFLYYSRRADPSGDTSGGLVKPSLFTGAATTNVPIVLPPGTRGVQPDLSLSYNSGRGRGNAGVGWSLELSRITRSTKYGTDLVQSWCPAQAVYLLDGEELVPSLGPTESNGLGCDAARYYARTDHFQKILFCDGSDYWTVFSKNGTKTTYGRRPTAYSKFRPASTTFEYYLDEVIDTHGLSWRADYHLDSPPRLDRIRFSIRSSRAPPWEQLGRSSSNGNHARIGTRATNTGRWRPTTCESPRSA